MKQVERKLCFFEPSNDYFIQTLFWIALMLVIACFAGFIYECCCWWSRLSKFYILIYFCLPVFIHIVKSQTYIYIYSCLQKMCQYIHIWSALWEGFNFRKHPWEQKKAFKTCSHRKIFMLNILKKLHVYPNYSGWK